MKKQKKEKDFYHLPTYPGGNEAFREFIKTNLRYPKEALEQKIQGKVYVSYEVNDNGEIVSALVTKGIGYGCDEEAIRIVKLLKYDKVKNRGVRLKSTVKTYIEFRLTEIHNTVSYNYVSHSKPQDTTTPPKEGDNSVSYNYTIKF